MTACKQSIDRIPSTDNLSASHPQPNAASEHATRVPEHRSERRGADPEWVLR